MGLKHSMSSSDSSLLIWFGGPKSLPQQQALCRGVWQGHSLKHSSGHGLGFPSLSLFLWCMLGIGKGMDERVF